LSAWTRSFGLVQALMPLSGHHRREIYVVDLDARTHRRRHVAYSDYVDLPSVCGQAQRSFNRRNPKSFLGLLTCAGSKHRCTSVGQATTHTRTFGAGTKRQTAAWFCAALDRGKLGDDGARAGRNPDITARAHVGITARAHVGITARAHVGCPRSPVTLATEPVPTSQAIAQRRFTQHGTVK